VLGAFQRSGGYALWRVGLWRNRVVDASLALDGIVVQAGKSLPRGYHRGRYHSGLTGSSQPRHKWKSPTASDSCQITGQIVVASFNKMYKISDVTLVDP